MEPFQLIRQFFTKMSCRFCESSFIPDDIHLIGRGRNYFVVAIHCHDCGQHNGDAAVGLEQMSPEEARETFGNGMSHPMMNPLAGMGSSLGALLSGIPGIGENIESHSVEISLEDLLEALGGRRVRRDPELTPGDIERLSDLPAINDDDVLEAHEFFENLDSNWMNHIPEHLKTDLNEENTDQ